MTRNSLTILLFFACVACRPAAERTAGVASGPEVRATVVTIRTTIQPGDRNHIHNLVIVGNQVRSTDELDSWRLFDVNANTVTFVDDIAKTRRTEPLSEVIRKRSTSTAGPLAPHFPNPRVAKTGVTRPLLGTRAEQVLIEAGTYRRELWFGEHPAVPSNVYSMMHMSEQPSSPLIPMMQQLDEVLGSIEGFPLLDRSEVTFGNERNIVQRSVTSVEQREVPAALIRVPRDYLDLTSGDGKKVSR